MINRKLVHVSLGALIGALASYVVIRSASAVGIPTTGALTYAGVLEDSSGAPLTGSKNIALEVYDAATAGQKRCEVSSQPYTLVAGRFEIPLPDTCATAVQGDPDLWIDVLVDGASTGRAKLGAVPYAIEARRATEAGGNLKNELGWKAVNAMAAAGCARLGATPPNAGMVVPRSAQSCETVCAAQPLKTCKGTIAVQLDDVNAPAAGQSIARYYEYVCSNTSAGDSPTGKASPYGALLGYCCCT
jgi:hypothetical protein